MLKLARLGLLQSTPHSSKRDPRGKLSWRLAPRTLGMQYPTPAANQSDNINCVRFV